MSITRPYILTSFLMAFAINAICQINSSNATISQTLILDNNYWHKADSCIARDPTNYFKLLEMSLIEFKVITKSLGLNTRDQPNFCYSAAETIDFNKINSYPTSITDGGILNEGLIYAKCPEYLYVTGHHVRWVMDLLELRGHFLRTQGNARLYTVRWDSKVYGFAFQSELLSSGSVYNSFHLSRVE